MEAPPIRFDDGAAYEQGMAVWSRLAGQIFLEWLAPQKGLRWVDIGCGNGVFTEMLIEHCAPSETQAIDPSEGQLAFARTRPGARSAVFRQGDAMALPYGDSQFDAAVMALVIFFVPNPARGVAEMVRAVRPGGLVSAYVWDALHGGFPMAPIQAELRAIGMPTPMPPSADVSAMPALTALWRDAGLGSVETREITVQRSFPDFEAYWDAIMRIGALEQTTAGLPAGDLQRLKDGVRARIGVNATGGVTGYGRANAIRGLVKDHP